MPLGLVEEITDDRDLERDAFGKIAPSIGNLRLRHVAESTNTP
jgi:hypothetical protein